MELIDAYKAMKSIDEIVCSMSVCINSDYCHGMTAMKDAAIHAIENQPTVDAVQVVRCKDCKHYMTIHCTCDGCCISPDWYCADGERKGGAELNRTTGEDNGNAAQDVLMPC